MVWLGRIFPLRIISERDRSSAKLRPELMWQQASGALCRCAAAQAWLAPAMEELEGEHAMWDAKNKTVSGCCYENAFMARQNKSIKTDELPARSTRTRSFDQQTLINLTVERSFLATKRAATFNNYRTPARVPRGQLG